MVSVIKNQNTFVLPFGTFVWLVCSLVAWGSCILKYDIGVVGVICWIISILGIIAFVFSLFAFIADR